MAEPDEIVGAAGKILGGNSEALKGCRIVVTSGPTREPIDPVRYISNHSSGHQGAAIAEALKVNTSLKEVWLSLNNIGDEGAKAIAEALKVNTSLKVVSLPNNKIGDEGAKAIAEARKENPSIKIYIN